LFAGVSTAIIY